MRRRPSASTLLLGAHRPRPPAKHSLVGLLGGLARGLLLIFWLGVGDRAHHDFILTPGSHPVVEGVAWSSRQMLLNGEALEMGAGGVLPSSVLTGSGKRSEARTVVLGPLSVAFAVFPAAAAAGCS